MTNSLKATEPENPQKLGQSALTSLVMPMQPIRDGRFVANNIVKMLLDTHPTMDMNTIAMLSFTEQEQMQFAQLIGYSLNGFSELSYVDDETYAAAETIEAEGVSDTEAKNDALRHQLACIRTGLKAAATAAFKIHPDDLEA